MITLHEPEWSSENASELRAFLKTATGNRLLANLSYRRPSFLASLAHPHKSFANSREIHGYEQAVRTLLGLIEAEEQPLSAMLNRQDASVSYPDLDDESKWASGTETSS